MHLQLVGLIEGEVALIADVAVDALATTRDPFALIPLVITIFVVGFPTIALTAYAIHD
jgi:hypothetical protein